MTPTEAATSTASRDEGRAPSRNAGVPILYVALECDHPGAHAAGVNLEQLDEVVIGRETTGPDRRIVRSGRRVEISCPDVRMSSTHARLIRVLDRWVIEDAGSKNGVRVNGAPQTRAALSRGDVIELGRTVLLFDESVNEATGAPFELRGATLLSTFQPALEQTLRALERIAAARVNVVVHGESGTGKELVARAVHSLSGRTGEFVAVNCGALPESIAEAELFGARRGAFTGATEDRLGLVRASSGGTLFLDEIGDLPTSLQAALLRTLQESEVLPIGATKPVPVDLRVVSASHRDLTALVEQQRFRADLFARLSGLTLRLPPLRERREDLGLLVSTLLTKHGAAQSTTLSTEAARALFGYGWPLNVRELEKALQVAVALAGGERIELHHLPEPVRAGASSSSLSGFSAQPSRAPTLSNEESARLERLLQLLRQHQGNISAVSREMGVARMQVQRWLKRYGIDAQSFRA